MTILPSPIPHPLDFSPWDLPGWAYEALEWVVGFDWPEGNEKTTWDVADQWYELVGAMATPREDAADAAARFVAAYGGSGSGTTIDSFITAWKAVADGDEAPLNALVAFAAEMGKVVDECAQDIEAAKLEAWIELGIFVIELIGLAVTVALTLGAASPAAAGIIAATRMAIQQIFKRLIAQLSRKAIKQALKEAGQRAAKDLLTKKGLQNFGKRALREGAEEAREEALTNLAVQGYQAGVGHSDGIDLADLGRSTLAGAAGGVSAHGASIGAGHKSGVFRGAAAEVFGEVGGAAAMGDLPGFEELAKAGTSGAAGSAVGNTRQSFQEMGANLDAGNGLELNDLPATSTSSSGTGGSAAFSGLPSGNGASSNGSVGGVPAGGSVHGGGSSGGSFDGGGSSGAASSGASSHSAVSSGGGAPTVSSFVSAPADTSGGGSSTVSSFVSTPADTSVTASAASSGGHSGGQPAASPPTAAQPASAVSSEGAVQVSPTMSTPQASVAPAPADVTLSSVAPPVDAPAHSGTGIQSSSPVSAPVNAAPAGNTVTNTPVALAPATGSTGPVGSPSIATAGATPMAGSTSITTAGPAHTAGPTSLTTAGPPAATVPTSPSSPNANVSLTGGGPATVNPSTPGLGTPASGPSPTTPSNGPNPTTPPVTATTPGGPSTAVTTPQALDTGGSRTTGLAASTTTTTGPSPSSPPGTTSPATGTPTANTPSPPNSSTTVPTQPGSNDHRPTQAGQPRADAGNNVLPLPGGAHAAPHLTYRTPEQARHEQEYFNQYDRNKQAVANDLRAKAAAPFDAAIRHAQTEQQRARRAALKATLALNFKQRDHHRRMEAIHRQKELHARTQQSLAANAPLADLDLITSPYYGTANTEYAPLTRSDLPVHGSDRSALTGSGSPANARTSRPYGRPGGLREPLRLHQADLELTVPRDHNNMPVRTPDPRGPFLRLLNDGGPSADPTRGVNCLDCSLSFYETYVHGRPTVSAPRTVDGYRFGLPDLHSGELGGPDRAELATGSAFTAVTQHDKTKSLAAVKADTDRGFEKIIDTLQRGGHGSTAIIINVWEGGGSHAWNAVNHHGSILFIDPQSGEYADATNFVPGSARFPSLYGHTGVNDRSNVVELHTLMVDGQGNPMAVENTPHTGYNGGTTPVPPPPPPLQHQQAAPQQPLPPPPPINPSPQPQPPINPSPQPPAPPTPAPNPQPPGPRVSTPHTPDPAPPVSVTPQPTIDTRPEPPTPPVDAAPKPPIPSVDAAPEPPAPVVDVAPETPAPIESQATPEPAPPVQPPTVRPVTEQPTVADSQSESGPSDNGPSESGPSESGPSESGPSVTAPRVDDFGRTTSEETSPRDEPAPYRQDFDPLAVLDPVSMNGPADRDPLAVLDPSNDPRLAEAPPVDSRAAAEQRARDDYHYENDRTRREFDAEYRQRMAQDLRRQADARFEQAEHRQDPVRNAYGRGDLAETARNELERNRLQADAESLRDRARLVESGVGVGDVELTGNDWERVNESWSDLAPGPVEAGDRSALTGDDRPRSVDTTRRYNHRGGLRPPLRIHQTDLERAMPRDADGTVIRQADPRDGGWFGLVNDGGPEADPTRSINCGDTVLSLFETYMHGRPRVSAPRTFDGYQDGDPTRPIGAEQGVSARIEATTGGRFEGLTDVGGLDPDDARVQVRMAEIRLRSHLTDLGHGSFAFITTQDQAGRTHAFAAVNQNGTVLYLDPQTRQVSSFAPIHTHSGLGAPCDILRMDALVVDGQADPRPLTAGADPFVTADPAGPGGDGPPWPVADSVEGTARGRSLTPPNKRHTVSGARRGEVKADNTVYLRGYEHVAATDVQAIAAGQAVWHPMEQQYEVNGRRYGVKTTGTVYPISGTGMVRLDRIEYQALQQIAQANGDLSAAPQLHRNPNFLRNPDAVARAKEIYDGTYQP